MLRTRKIGERLTPEIIERTMRARERARRADAEREARETVEGARFTGLVEEEKK